MGTLILNPTLLLLAAAVAGCSRSSRDSDIENSRAHCLARVRLELSPLGLVGDAEMESSALEVLDGLPVHVHEGAIAVTRSSGTPRFRFRCRMARGRDREWVYLEFTLGPERRSP